MSKKEKEVKDLNTEYGKKHVWQTVPDIIDTIISICKIHGITAIWEIGTFQGESSKAFAEAGFKVITSDVEQHIKDEDKVESIEYILGNSPDICMSVAKKLQGEKVAVFIDGDHSYDGCLTDLKACEKAGLNKLMFFHDATNGGCPGISRVIREQKNNPHYGSIILDTYDATGIGIMARI